MTVGTRSMTVEAASSSVNSKNISINNSTVLLGSRLYRVLLFQVKKWSGRTGRGGVETIIVVGTGTAVGTVIMTAEEAIRWERSGNIFIKIS